MAMGGGRRCRAAVMAQRRDTVSLAGEHVRVTVAVGRTRRHPRIGGGDGFASGLIYGLLTDRSADESLRLGWAHGALLTTFPGDISMAKLEEVETLAKGGSARVQR